MDAVQKALRLAKADGGGSATSLPTGAVASGAASSSFDPTAYVQGLYTDILNRPGETAGIQGWVNALSSGEMTPEQVRQGFLSSSENTVQDYYTNLLQRNQLDPDAYNWVTALENRSLTPAQVRERIMGSEEYRTLTGATQPTTDTTNTTGTTPVDITNQGMPLIYNPPPYKDYGATASAYRVASGLENLPAPFATLSPVVPPPPSGGVVAGSNYQNILNQLGTGTTGGTTGGTTTAPTGGTPGGGGGTGSGISASDINQLYTTYLGRPPEEGAAQNWMNAINSGQLSFNEVMGQISGSPEAQVYGYYQSILGRAPDAGAQGWINAIISGQMTPAEVQAAIQASPEAQGYTGGYKSGGAVKSYADGGATYEDLVNAAYQDFLGRAPDDAGFKAWLDALTSGQIKPADFETKFKGAGYEDDIVNAYNQSLNRTPTTAEINSWNDALTSGNLTVNQLMQRIAGSPEATMQTVPMADRYSELQDGRAYAIDIGNVERSPELGRVARPVNVQQAWENSEIERLKRELAEAQAAALATTTDTNSVGGGTGGGGDGTSGGLGDTAGGGGYGSAPGNSDSSAGSPAGDGGGPMGAARGGMIGNNAVNNALRLLKADRR